MTKVHFSNYLTLPKPVVTLKDAVMNRLDQFVLELKTEFPMLSAYDFTLNAVVPSGEQTEVMKPMNKTIRIVLDRMNRSETDFLKSVEKAQASVTNARRDDTSGMEIPRPRGSDAVRVGDLVRRSFVTGTGRTYQGHHCRKD
jgi:hypothetical protein